MHKCDLLALNELQDNPVIIDPQGKALVADLTMWSDATIRADHLRHRINAVAHSGMSIEELCLFFARAGLAAGKSWNAEHSVLGRIKNMLTESNAGYAQVPGRILKQAMDQMDDETGEAVVPSATYLLRADVAIEFRDRLTAMRENKI